MWLTNGQSYTISCPYIGSTDGRYHVRSPVRGKYSNTTTLERGDGPRQSEVQRGRLTDNIS